jgi:hypothetical protein
VNSQKVRMDKSEGDFDGCLGSALYFQLIVLSVKCEAANMMS